MYTNIYKVKNVEAETIYFDLFEVYGEMEGGIHFHWMNDSERAIHLIDDDYRTLRGDKDELASSTSALASYMSGRPLRGHIIGEIKKGNELHKDILLAMAMACYKKYRTLPDFEDYYEEFTRED